MQHPELQVFANPLENKVSVLLQCVLLVSFLTLNLKKTFRCFLSGSYYQVNKTCYSQQHMGKTAVSLFEQATTCCMVYYYCTIDSHRLSCHTHLMRNISPVAYHFMSISYG